MLVSAFGLGGQHSTNYHLSALVFEGLCASRPSPAEMDSYANVFRTMHRAETRQSRLHQFSGSLAAQFYLSAPATASCHERTQTKFLADRKAADVKEAGRAQYVFLGVNGEARDQIAPLLTSEFISQKVKRELAVYLIASMFELKGSPATINTRAEAAKYLQELAKLDVFSKDEIAAFQAMIDIMDTGHSRGSQKYSGPASFETATTLAHVNGSLALHHLYKFDLSNAEKQNVILEAAKDDPLETVGFIKTHISEFDAAFSVEVLRTATDTTLELYQRHYINEFDIDAFVAQLPLFVDKVASEVLSEILNKLLRAIPKGTTGALLNQYQFKQTVRSWQYPYQSRVTGLWRQFQHTEELGKQASADVLKEQLRIIMYTHLGLSENTETNEAIDLAVASFK